MKIAAKPLAALGVLVKKKQANGMLKKYEEAGALSKEERELMWDKIKKNSGDKKKLIDQTKVFVEREKKEKDGGKFTYKELPEIIKTKLPEVKKEIKEEKEKKNKK